MTSPRFLRSLDSSARSRIRLTGKDARAFLHRLSTQHVKDLVAGDVRNNVLTTDKGRVVDWVRHIDCGDDGVLLVGSHNRAAALLAWLDRYLFTEDVTLVDESAGAPLYEGLLADDVPAGRVSDVDGVRWWRDIDRGAAWGMALGAVPPSARGDALDVPAAEALRIAAVIPGDGELCDSYTPLDLGLEQAPFVAVHWDKGCYIGQEVIARLDTYAKQQRGLFGLIAPGMALAPGTTVHSANGATLLGTVTSAVAHQSDAGAPSALAVLKLRAEGPDATVVSVNGAAVMALARSAVGPALAGC